MRKKDKFGPHLRGLLYKSSELSPSRILRILRDIKKPEMTRRMTNDRGQRRRLPSFISNPRETGNVTLRTFIQFRMSRPKLLG